MSEHPQVHRGDAASEEPQASGVGIVARVVGFWIVLPLALIFLIKMLIE